jgi:hypothetical protein
MAMLIFGSAKGSQVTTTVLARGNQPQDREPFLGKGDPAGGGAVPAGVARR